MVDTADVHTRPARVDICVVVPEDFALTYPLDISAASGEADTIASRLLWETPVTWISMVKVGLIVIAFVWCRRPNI